MTTSATVVTFVGEDYWTAHLAEGLNARFGDQLACSAISLQAPRGVLCSAAKKLVRADVIVRVGFRAPGLPEYDPSKYVHATRMRDLVKKWLFGTAFGRRLRKAVVFTRIGRYWQRRYIVHALIRAKRWVRPLTREFTYWIGTDALRLLQESRSGVMPAQVPRRIASSTNIAVAPHLIEELVELGIHATLVGFPGLALAPPDEIPTFPETMTVVGYVPDARRDFYGLPMILAAARRLPSLSFQVHGGSGVGVENQPGNLEFVGRVDDMSRLYGASSVVIRMVEHDGQGATVVEGLVYGRPVIYSYPMKHTIHVRYGDTEGLVAALESLNEQHRTGGIQPNKAGRQWAITEFDPDVRFAQLRDVLLDG